LFIYALPAAGETVSLDSPIGDINLQRQAAGQLSASKKN